MAQIVLQTPWVLFALPALWLLVVIFAWRRHFKPFGPFLLRLAIIVLVALGLAQPVIPPPPTNAAAAPEQLVLLVDRSAGLTPAQQQAMQAQVDRLRAQFPQTTVLDFADRAVITTAADADKPLNTNVSNLAAALSTGAQVLNGQPGRLVLFSDGVPTEGDTNTVLAELTDQKIPVDVFIPAPGGESSNDVRLVSLTTSPALRQGDTSASLDVTVYSLRPAQATLSVVQDKDTLLREDAVSLEPGLNRFNLPLKTTDLGLHTFVASVTASDDTQPANNRLAAISQVYPAPQILVVGDEPADTANFAHWLEQTGFVPQLMRPADLPDRLSALEPYTGMVLLNVPRRSLKLEQMLAVQEYARSLGRGLLVSGGRNSFSLGQYEDTPLAELLPVSLEPPIRSERPPVALLLIIDHSGSMVEERGALGTRLVMAKEAAIRSMNILAPQDLIGVLIFDSNYEWIIPFTKVSDGAALLNIQQKVSRIPGGSATRILQALEVGINEFIQQNPSSAARHIVLFSDGKSYDGERGLPDYDAIVDQALAADITLSTISIGAATDEALMAHLAERGRGRYYYAGTPDELPELTISESDILRSTAVQEGDYEAAAAHPHPILRNFVTLGAACEGTGCPYNSEENKIPPLSGYIALTPKPHAEIALQVGPGDPLLAVWGYGLGRVAAWSSDAGHEWTSNWQTWPGVARFWGQVVEYTLPAPNLGLLQLKTEVAAGGLVTLTAEGVTTAGQTVDLVHTQATLTTPGGREVPLPLRQVAPGRYQQQVRVADPGAYRVSLSQDRADEPAQTVATGFVVAYPAEYALPAEGAGEPLLRHIAGTTGGQVVANADSFLAAAVAASSQHKTTEPLILWPWLLLGALLLWPLEIAWRRWGRLRIH